jgi:membrane-bound lytic murein transglycosylase D
VKSSVTVFILSAALLLARASPADWSGAASPLKPINAFGDLDSSVAADVDAEFFAPWVVSNNTRPLTVHERTILLMSAAGMFAPDPVGQSLIESQFALFTQQLRPRLKAWLARSEKHLPTARAVFASQGLPLQLAYLPFIESGYSPRALSTAGARGIWQFMPATGRRYGLACCDGRDERTDPAKSAMAAAAYLRDLYLMFGDWSLALAAYNAGEGKIGRLIKRSKARTFFELAVQNDEFPHAIRLRRETLYYVPRFIAMVRIMENLERLGFDRPRWKR